MFWALLCGLFYGALALDAWRKETARLRNERIWASVREWYERYDRPMPMDIKEAFGAGALSPIPDECYPGGATDLPFSDDPIPDDELPWWITGDAPPADVPTDLFAAGYCR